ncbi:hypothetical protein RSAG8_06737, partial [Rhizoctonia solani AG-8 WAC10335]
MANENEQPPAKRVRLTLSSLKTMLPAHVTTAKALCNAPELLAIIGGGIHGQPLPPPPHAESPRHSSRLVQPPSPVLPLDDNHAHAPSPNAPRRVRRHASPANLPGFNPIDRHEHRFDELLPRQAFPDLDVDNELLNMNAEEDEPEEDEIFDEFGLPRIYHEPPDEDQQPFVLPWENQPAEGPDPDPNPEPDGPIDPAEYCAAFQEHPLVCNAYVDAIVQKILYGANQHASTHQLKAAQRQLRSNPDVPVEDLARMALTIRTVERRLGLDSSDIVKIYMLCPLCGRSYSPTYISDANTDACQNDNCDGVLYDIQKLASGQRKRVSRRTYPYASIIAWIHRLLNQPGMSEFQPTREGNYSVGACYIALNNLPRHLRFLRENICLVLVMPGPKEPDDYALDQMLAPLIEELLQLKQGESHNLFGEDATVYRDQVVYAELSQHIADLIACIKVGGAAGLKSELNFCLYCRTRLSSLSVPAGFIRQELPYRDPDEDLNNAYYWQSLETMEERKAFFDFTGNRFTVLHRLPGWHTSTCSPPDAMHLLYLGGMNWILNRNLFQPGMLNKRLPTDEDPVDRFNACLDRMWLPRNFSRLPPKLGQTNTRIKADQWKLATRVVFIPLYMAFRAGDTIPNACIPRGNKSSKGAKNQASRARALHRERQKHYAFVGQPNECPLLDACFPSRNLQFHYKQVLRYCVATGTLDKRTVTPNEILFGTELLETMCIDYTKHNVPKPLNFHMMMHFQEAMLKYGSLYNSHVWGLERANGVLSGMSHNGRGGGMLEGTLMRGWWGIANLQNLIKMFQSLRNCTPDDDTVLEDLLSALRGGPEHALQRGALATYIAQTKTAYTRLHGIQEPVRLSKQSHAVNLRKTEFGGLYPMFLNFCVHKWPHAGIFGDNMAQGRLYVPPKGVIRIYSHVEYNGTRYGSFNHTSGRGYCYGYVGPEHHAARIEWIMGVDFPDHPELHTICIFIRRFQPPIAEPDFPWGHWDINLGTASWEFDELDDLETVAVDSLSGTFALFEVPMLQADYWVTVSLDSISPEREDPDDDE